MNKYEFLSALREKLSGLPKEDAERSVDYYSEIIDDRIEDGLGEEEAVKAMGSVEEVASQILMEIPLPKLVRGKVRPKRVLRAWEILLLVLGFPVWLPLLIAAMVLVLAVYIVLWSLVVVLYSVDIAFAALGAGGILGSFVFVVIGNSAVGAMFFGAGLVGAGLMIFMLFGCNQAAKGVLWLSKKILLGIKSCFVRKGEIQ